MPFGRRGVVKPRPHVLHQDASARPRGDETANGIAHGPSPPRMECASMLTVSQPDAISAAIKSVRLKIAHPAIE